MKVLIVATSHTDPDVMHQVRAGKHHRIDYIELADRFQSDYVDYGAIADNHWFRHIEEILRLDLSQAAGIARQVNQKKYDVIISLSERVGIPLSHLLDRRIKHIVHFHHPLSSKVRLFRMLGTFQRWDRMIVLTRATAELLPRHLGVDPQKILMLPSPIDSQFYKPFADGASAAQDHVFSLGLSHRDYPTLIRAMRQLPHIRCHFGVGSTWLNSSPDYAQQALPPNIVVQPFVHPHVLRERYATSRFIIVPIRRTQLWSAGCTTVAQAQAMGKAIVATRNPGMSDYVLDGETGLLVEQGNAQAMAEAIDTLWRDPARTAAMGRRASEWAATQFSLDRWLAAVTELTHSLI